MKGFSRIILGSLVVFFALSTVAAAASDSTSLRNTKPTEVYVPVDNIIVTKPGGIQTYYPENYTVSADPVNTDPAYLDSLPSCPGDPSNGSAAKIAPICPDINNKWTKDLKDGIYVMMKGVDAYEADGTPKPALTKYCPDLCTSTRYVHYTTSSTTTGQIYNRVDQFKPAICPPGYSQVTALKSDYDVTYNNSTVLLAPTDDTQRISFQSQGADCNTYSTTAYIARAYCSYSTDSKVQSKTNECNFDNNGYGFKTLPNGTTMYGKCTSCQGAKGTHDTYGCFQAGDSTCSKYLVPPGVSSDTQCNMLVGYSTAFKDNRFVRVICALPPGYYLTGNTVPTKVVCSRVKSTWQMQQ